MNGSSKSIVVPSNGFPSTISTTPFEIENCYLFGDYCKKPLKGRTVSIISSDSSETNDNARFAQELCLIEYELNINV